MNEVKLQVHVYPLIEFSANWFVSDLFMAELKSNIRCLFANMIIILSPQLTQQILLDELIS